MLHRDHRGGVAARRESVDTNRRPVSFASSARAARVVRASLAVSLQTCPLSPAPTWEIAPRASRVKAMQRTHRSRRAKRAVLPQSRSRFKKPTSRRHDVTTSRRTPTYAIHASTPRSAGCEEKTSISGLLAEFEGDPAPSGPCSAGTRSADARPARRRLRYRSPRKPSMPEESGREVSPDLRCLSAAMTRSKGISPSNTARCNAMNEPPADASGGCRRRLAQ